MHSTMSCTSLDAYIYTTVFGVSVCTRCTCVSHTYPARSLVWFRRTGCVASTCAVATVHGMLLAEYRYFFLCTSYEHRSDPLPPSVQCSFEKNIGNLRTAPKGEYWKHLQLRLSAWLCRRSETLRTAHTTLGHGVVKAVVIESKTLGCYTSKINCQ